MWDNNYRQLEEGEIIKEGDEVDCCGNSWHDAPVWMPTECLGQPAPDPLFPAHRIYRRFKIKEVK
jgi:hypothetical protein